MFDPLKNKSRVKLFTTFLSDFMDMFEFWTERRWETKSIKPVIANIGNETKKVEIFFLYRLTLASQSCFSNIKFILVLTV